MFEEEPELGGWQDGHLVFRRKRLLEHPGDRQQSADLFSKGGSRAQPESGDQSIPGDET